MARQFDDASTEYLEVDSTPVVAAPFTISCWFNSDDLTTSQALVSVADKDVIGDFWVLAAGGAIGGDPVFFGARDNGALSNAVTGTGYSANTWHHACGVETATNNRAAFIDGGSKGTDATVRSPAGADRIAIARVGDSTPTNYMSGAVAEVGIWSVALSDAEVALLAKGFSPLFIQPENLVFYAPLIRDDDNDWIGGFDLTAFNTPTVAPHPPLVVHPTLPSFPVRSIQTLSPTGIASDEAFGTPDISLRALGVTGIASAEAFGLPVLQKRQGAIVTIPDQKPEFITTGFSEYKVRLKDQSSIVVAEFDQAAWRSLSLNHKVNESTSCRLEIDDNDARRSLFELDGQIEVWRRNPIVGLDWTREWEGMHRTSNRQIFAGDNESFVSWSYKYIELLRRRYIMYVAGSAQANKSGVGETVMKEYANENAGPAALLSLGRLQTLESDGVTLGLSIEADSGGGSSWEGGRAYKNLLAVLQEIGRSTGVDFDVVSLDDPQTFEFRTYVGQRGADRTTVGLDENGLNAAGNKPVIFSVGFGNMAVPILSEDRTNEVTNVSVLGQGVETEREVVHVGDDDAISASPWNRRETVLQANQESATSGLTSAGEEKLAEAEKREDLSFNVLQLASSYYGVHYFLGDLITARYKDQEFNKRIDEVRITVSSNAQNGENVALTFTDKP